MKPLQNKLQGINPLYIAGGGFLLVSLFTGGIDEIKTQQQQASVIKAQRRELAQEQIQLDLAHAEAEQQLAQERLQLELSQAELEAEQPIADQRYLNGCNLVVNTIDPTQYVSLTLGEPVIDMGLNRPFGDGNVFCDVFGNTGIIKGGVVADMARTGDRQIIQDAINAQGINAHALPPAREGI